MKKLLSAVLCAATLMCACSCDKIFNLNGLSGDSEQTQSSSEQTETVITEKVLLKKKQYTLFLQDSKSEQKISASVYDGGKLVENAEITYEVANSAVAEVAEDGRIIPKGVGITEIKVIYKKASATAEVRIMDQTTAENVNTFHETYVNTYGRTYIKDGKLCLDHVATGVEVAIDGTALTAEIEASANVYLCVYVDGAEEYERIQVSSGKKTYTLASGLEKGFHTVRVVKSSEVYDGQIRVVSLSSEGFYTAPEKSSFRVEFIGDSITAGYGALGATGAQRTVENSDACSSYAYYTAQKLGVDYSTVAIQGICVKANMWIEDCMSDVYKIVSPLNPTPYDFSDKADVVVVNLGTNDAGYITSKDFDYSEQFPQDYLALLQYIREKNPDAYIICLYGFMGKQGSVDKGIKQAVEEFNDEKAVYLSSGFIQNGLGANGHPSQDAQKTWGETLAEYIELNIMKN